MRRAIRPGFAIAFFVVAVIARAASQSPDRARLLDPDGPEFQEHAPPVSRIRLETSKGPITLEMQRAWAPRGADRIYKHVRAGFYEDAPIIRIRAQRLNLGPLLFYTLVRAGFYDDARIFRIRAGLWAQFGINGTPAIAKRWRNRTIPDDPPVLSNVRGTVAYAFKDPNGRTTQVFINLRDNSTTHDSEPFVPFARVIDGMAVADAWYSDYGEAAGGGIRAGKQDPVFEGGTAYLIREFPKLDRIDRATILH